MDELLIKAIQYNTGMPKQSQHLIKVHSLSKIIGTQEGLDEHSLFILEVAAILHDIGIKDSLRIYGDSNGKHQEELGPDIAISILGDDYDEDVIERVCFLIAHHHTYNNIDALDYQILVEADFIVNMYEDHASTKACQNVYDTIFKTKTGKSLFKMMFLEGDINEDG